MTWLTELIDNTKALTPLERFNFITKADYVLLNEFVTNFQGSFQQNDYIEAVILLAEYKAVARNFKDAYDDVMPLKTLSLTALQQAHIERIIGSYLGKDVYDGYVAGIASLTKAAELFLQKNDLKWAFNTLMNLIGVYSRHALEVDKTVIETLYQDIMLLKDYDDKDHHGAYVTAYWMANYYFCTHAFQQAGMVFRNTAGYQDNQHLQRMGLTSKFDELKQKIEQQMKDVNRNLIKTTMWQPERLSSNTEELLANSLSLC